jgi:hypothetical protein
MIYCMQKGFRITRIIAAACSFALMGGYVYMRATNRSLFTGQVVAQTTPQSVPGPTMQREFAPGPKSAPVVAGQDVTYSDQHIEFVPDRMMISGSKTFTRTVSPSDLSELRAVDISSDVFVAPTTQPAKPPVNRTMMGSSKGTFTLSQQSVFVEPSLTLQPQGNQPSTQPATQPRILMPGSKSDMLSR